MKVLVFLPYLALGGAERQGLIVAAHLQTRGHLVEVWGFAAPRGGATLVPELARRKLSHKQLTGRLRLSSRFSGDERGWRSWIGRQVWSRRLAEIARGLPRQTFDAVIPFTTWPSLLACLLRDQLGAATCVWNHRAGPSASGLHCSPDLKRQILSHPPRFVANSKAGAAFIQATFELPAGQIAVIPNTYDADLVGRTMDGSLPDRVAGAIRLIHVANFFPEKDYDTLLHAIRILKTRRIPCRLHVCGEFPTTSGHRRFAALTDDLDIQDCLILHGATSRPALLNLLAEADVGVLSSKSEGQPNSIMEYMLAGLPVVATRIPGIHELVGDDNAAWLFPVGDAAQLAERIERLQHDAPLRAALGQQNRDRIVSHFGPAQVLPQWTALVESPPRS